MKNRERIKSALLLSLQEETREQCKEGGFTKAKTEEFLISKSQEFDHVSEYIIEKYDKFLINTLANELSNRLKQSVEKDNQIIISHFQGMVNTINSNHTAINNNISSLSVYHRLMREKNLDEEIIHLQEDFELVKQHKKALDRIAAAEANKVSWYFVFIAFSSAALWCGLIYKIGWKDMEQWTWISAVIIVFLNGLYYAFFENNFTREDLKKDKLEKSTEHVYQLYKFDESQIKRYETLLEMKNKELDKLKEEKTAVTATNRVGKGDYN